MDPAEPDGITSAPTPHPSLHPSMAPPGAVTKGRLQSLEKNLLVLERNYGATHPQVMLLHAFTQYTWVSLTGNGCRVDSKFRIDSSK